MQLHDLIKTAQQGDADAFDELVRRFDGMAHALAYTFIGDHHLAEDAVQEAFVEAYLHLSQLREPAAFVVWLRRIIFKQCDRLTRGKRLPTGELADDATSDGDVTTNAIARELRDEVRTQIAALPPHQRLVVGLFYLADTTQSDIAEFLDLPISTIKKRLFDSRQRLRHTLAPVAAEHLPTRPLEVTVRFVVALRTSNLPRIRELVQRDPTLVHVREYRDSSTHMYTATTEGYTPLHRAASEGNVELIDLLLNYDPEINAATAFGETPLHSAVAFNRTETVRRLVEHGAIIDPQCANGMTPLHWATIRSYRDIEDVLRQHGARADLPDRHGRTPDDWAALKLQSINDQS